VTGDKAAGKIRSGASPGTAVPRGTIAAEPLYTGIAAGTSGSGAATKVAPVSKVRSRSEV